IPDLEGAEFVNLEAARQEAIQAARELVQEMAHTGVIDLRIVFAIEGSDGQRAVVPFSEAIEVLR
ncbi:MAG: hypothetical protein JWM36_256, partial [Hyphomicrobiales bacterium]|nr:hypothetical protein [Hyphomicrobiales bacterium]